MADESHETISKNSMPRWYQDLSIPQMEKVFSLGNIIRDDYAERVTGRTQRALGDIGVTSTFLKISPQQIKKLRRSTDLDPVKFLLEIYRIVTGKYFTEEEYKKHYDCNERIILSAIAFLLLPEIVMELHDRLPMGVPPKLPPKPVPRIMAPRQNENSSFLGPNVATPDLVTYKKELFFWRKKCAELPKPRVILPPFVPYSEKKNGTVGRNFEDDAKVVERDQDSPDSYQREIIDKEQNNELGNEINKSEEPRDIVDEAPEKLESAPQQKINIESQNDTKIPDEIRKSSKMSGKKTRSGQPRPSSISGQKNKRRTHSKAKDELPAESTASEDPKDHSVPRGSTKVRGNVKKKDSMHIKRKSKLRRSKLAIEQRDKNEDKNSELNKPPDDPTPIYFEKKPLHDGKEAHLIVTGISETEDSTQFFPVTQETSGIAYVTPENSDEDFFQALNYESKKSYPCGRENLSRNWQEWFRDVEEEFFEVEKEADKILKSVKNTLKLMGPETSCDPCCSCRQTRKANAKYHKTKTPQRVIESVVIDGENNKYVVGSLVMNSPAASPSESTENLAQFVPSYERIIKNKIISGVTNEKGEMNYYVSGVSKEVEHVPRKIISQKSLEKPVKNVPPCGCAIEKMINEGILEITSDDNIPWSKRDEICMGRKYRPEETGAGSCRDYPNDKTCRRNPFKKKIDEQIRAKLREKENFGKNAYPEGEKKMYSMADFQPCGDEDGMAVCGGPWGAINIPDEEELARREAEAKRILESPPCGDKPGRAICGAPFGSRHPIPKKPKKEEDDEDEEEEEEEDEEEKKKSRVRAPRQRVAELKKEKHLNRGAGCSAVTDKNDNVLEPLDTSPGRGVKKKENSRLARKAARLEKKKKSLAGQEEMKNLESNSKSSLLEATEDFEPSGPRNRDEEKRRSDAMKRLKKEWNRSIIMSNKLIVSPVVLPEEQPKKCQRETQDSGCCGSKKIFSDAKPQDSHSPGEGPFGWRTESEQALPAEKTLTYLVKPQDPMDRIAVRPGGKPCECRENRNAKKVLLYNVTGISKDGKSKRDEKLSRVIDGLIYITPEPSVRNSEEYIPEYELYDSPYDKCTRDRKNEQFKYIEKYLGPASLMKKQQKGPKPCGCSVVVENTDSPRLEPGANNLEKIQNPEKAQSSSEKPQESKILAKPEEPKKTSKLHSMKWSKACEDEGLVQFYARCRDNVPCWLRCVEFTKYGCCTMPKRLQVKRPVCECKYERKIVKREEEKKKWLSRQERLKSCKKQAFAGVEGISRPMRTETNLIVSDVKTIPGEETTADLRYCIDGVAQDYVMSPGECLLSGIGMHTPVTTPEPSESRLPTDPSTSKPHRHYPSPTISASRAVSGATETLQLRPSSNVNWAEKPSDARETRVDVLFQNGKSEDPTELTKLDGPADTQRKLSRSKKKRKSANSRGKKDDHGPQTKDKNGSEQIADPHHRKSTKYARSSNATDPDHRKSKSQARKIENKDHEVKRKSRNEGRASKDKDGGSGRKSKQEAPRSEGKSVDFEKVDSKDPAEIQDSHRKTMRASNIELRKNIARNDDVHDTKESVHVTKSTGNIIPQPDKTPDHERKKLPPGGDLKQMMQNELRKMAEEGYLFAKLPACHLMPQLQYWIMYRKGFPSCFPMEEKKKLMDRSLKVWESIQKPKPMKAPALGSPKKGTKTANSDESALMKREAELKTAQFYSQLRKARVLRSRMMWSLMEFGKFPGISFKRAFFTYQPSKESDGFVFRPWTNSEENEGSETAD